MSGSLSRVGVISGVSAALSIAAAAWGQSPTATGTALRAVPVKPIEIAPVFSDGSIGAWMPYDRAGGGEFPMASNVQFGAGETTKLRGPGPDFIPTDGADCGGFDPVCIQLCSQTRQLIQSCAFTYGGMRISATSSLNSSGQRGNVTQVFLAWANKRGAGQLDDFNPPRVIGDTVIEVLVYDNWFDPNCGPFTPNIIGGVLVNFGPLDGQCGADAYYFSTLNLREFPEVCMTVPGPAARFGYEVAFWFDAQRSARAANNQAMLWGTKDQENQGSTLEVGYIDVNYDGQYAPPGECINLRSGGCPPILAAMVDFWGNTVQGNINLWDNGTFVTQLRAGCANGDISEQEAPGTLLGAGVEVNTTRQADDFTVPAGQVWRIDDMRWYVFQPNSAPTDPIQRAFVQVWDGPPGAGGMRIAGDLTTNRLASSQFMGIYRVPGRDPRNCNFAIKRAIIDMTWMPDLSEGTYWLEVGMIGTPPFSGPLATLTVPRDVSTDNSRRFNVALGTWEQNFDNGLPFDFPFELEGKIISGSPCAANTYTLTLTGTCPGLVRLSWSGAEPSRQQGIVFARNLGSFVIPSGPCKGTPLGLGSQGIQLYSIISTGSGSGSVSAQAGQGACRGYVQLITVPSCATSNVAQVP